MTTITNDDRFVASAAAKPRVQRQYRGQGYYPVTVGGIVIGHVRKVTVHTGRSSYIEWAAETDEGQKVLFLDSVNFASREHAVTALGRTDVAVRVYRQAAYDGAFGTVAERDEKARRADVLEAMIAADEENVAPELDAMEGVQEYDDSIQAIDGVGYEIREYDGLGTLILEDGIWLLPGTEWSFVPAGPRSYFALYSGIRKFKGETLRAAREFAHHAGDAPSPQLDLDYRYRPTNQQLDIARGILDSDRAYTEVLVPVVAPGKSRGIWIVGQRVVGLPSYHPVSSDETYGQARDAASEVGEQYLREHHADLGGVYAYAIVSRNYGGYRGVEWSTMEDGVIRPE